MAPTGDGQVSTRQSDASFKYGPSAVRDIRYTTGLKQPYVQVKQRKNGQYVVVERLPVHHRARNHGLPTLQQSLVESEVKLNSIKPEWRPSQKVREKELRSSVSLPPINLGWRDKVTAMVGSLDNVTHEPGGGNKRIPRNSIRWDARSKVGSLDNLEFKSPRRIDTSQSDPVTSRRLSSHPTLAGSSPRYGAVASSGSLSHNLHYTPGGAEIITKPRRYEHVRSRVGSLDNVTHVPGGGDVLVQSKRTRWKAESKVGSLDNVRHVAGGGDVSITSERVTWDAKSKIGSLENADHVAGGGDVSIQHRKLSWAGRSRIGSLANIHHKPGGGVVRIEDNRVQWKAQPKVDTKPPRRRGSPDSPDSCEEHSPF